MNSLNTDTSSSLNQAKYRSIDVSNSYYPPNLFYRIPNNANIAPEFASLQNAYGANQLLATQFSFQYSDNQGLGEGLGGGNHSGAWPANGSQTRNNPPIDPSHFYSLPSHGHAQTADQNLFYPYGYGTANNVYWQHPSVLEYKSNNNTNNNNNNNGNSVATATNSSSNHNLNNSVSNQNFNLSAIDKSQTWPDTLVGNNHQYSPLTNSTLNYKSNISPIDHSNQLLPTINSTQANYELQLGSNGYHIAQVGVKMPVDEMHSLHDDRSSSNRKADHCNNVDAKYSSSNDPIDLDMESLQSHMTKTCTLNTDNNNSCPQQQHPYSVQTLSKQSLSNNNNTGNDFWTTETNKISNFNATKSYAKAAKLPSRSVTHLPNSSSSAYYLDNGYNGNTSRSNFKSITNGFATGYVRPSGGTNNWFNNTTNGQNWNTTKSKWNLETNNRSPANQAALDSSSKLTWASKVTLSNTDEQLRNAEYKVKEILQQINPKRLDINFDKTRYFVIKSYSEDDVHRSIKYKIWCSTKEGNRRLNEAFLGAQKIGGHILLFFSVNGSGHFCGVAEMTSVVDENVITGVWCQDKWRGKFSVKWLYVKDVPNTQLRHISTKVKVPKGNGETATEVKPITNLRDATELKSDRGSGSSLSSYSDDVGYQALKIIMDCKSTMSIFDDYLHYEKRELGIEGNN